jgi:glycosyltransferase involved in cell wall biosynthesis
MRILVVHNSYQHAGGEDVVFEQESRALEQHGHQVYRFQENNNRIAAMSSLSAAASTVWSQDAYRKISDLIRQTNCEVVHFHNTFPLISPSAYYAARSVGVPVVQTLHNYRILCPGAVLYRERRVCEACLKAPIALRGVMHGCYRNSRKASACVAAMSAAHRAVGTWRGAVNLYIAPTNFCRRKFIEAGFPSDRIAVKPGFVDPDPGPGEHTGGFCLFAGRLSPEKGLGVLLDAWRLLGPNYPLKIAGDGPLWPIVANAANEMPWIEWVSQQPLEKILELMGKAEALIDPSPVYATFGLVVVEAFAKGTPAIVASGTAPAELVQSRHSGLHFESGSPEKLADAVRAITGSPTGLVTMRRNARTAFVEHYTGETNISRLVGLYRQVLAGTTTAAA